MSGYVKLSDEQFQIRAEATAQLKKIAWRIAPLLEKSLKETDDPEVQYRIKQLLKRDEREKRPVNIAPDASSR